MLENTRNVNRGIWDEVYSWRWREYQVVQKGIFRT